MTIKNNKKIYAMVFVFLLSFLIILFRVKTNRIIIDGTIFNNFNFNPAFTNFMKIITCFGETWTFIIIAVILSIFIKNKYYVLSIFFNLGSLALINYILKICIRRPRPVETHLIDVHGYSFPSGHSATALAFYGFLIYLLYKNCQNKILKYFLISFLSILIILIGISRIYLGVHYESDVLGAFLYSFAYLLLFITLFNRVLEKK